MANDRTLTSANSIILLAVASLFIVPQQLQGFDVDDVVTTDPVSNAETRMGVDSRLSAGWVAMERKQTFALQADSLSCDLFDSWYATEQQIKEKLRANGTIQLPATGKSYAMFNGVLTQYSPIPTVKKILQPRQFVITWESIEQAPL